MFETKPGCPPEPTRRSTLRSSPCKRAKPRRTHRNGVDREPDPLLVATTTGGPSANYRQGSPIGFSIDELFAPLRAMALRCGWLWQPPFVVHDIRNLDDRALMRAAAEYRSTLSGAAKPARRAALVA